jgi:hypothetical protein
MDIKAHSAQGLDAVARGASSALLCVTTSDDVEEHAAL